MDPLILIGALLGVLSGSLLAHYLRALHAQVRMWRRSAAGLSRETERLHGDLAAALRRCDRAERDLDAYRSGRPRRGTEEVIASAVETAAGAAAVVPLLPRPESSPAPRRGFPFAGSSSAAAAVDPTPWTLSLAFDSGGSACPDPDPDPASSADSGGCSGGDGGGGF